MARIFLTGGTGFLGSHFLKRALNEGHEVLSLRRPSSQTNVPFEGNARGSQKRPFDFSSENFHWLDGELTDDWKQALGKCDVLVHLAAAGVSPQKATWRELFQTNVLDSIQLWENAAAAGLDRLIICGSCFEYGASASRYDFIPPDAPLQPTTSYGASKAAASVAALGMAREKNLKLSIIRAFQIFGEGQHEDNFWPALKRAALAGEDFSMSPGEQVRDFLPVQDAAAALLHAAVHAPLTPGQPIQNNLGSGSPQTLAHFASTWWNHWKAKGTLRLGDLPYRTGEIMRYVPALDGSAGPNEKHLTT